MSESNAVRHGRPSKDSLSQSVRISQESEASGRDGMMPQEGDERLVLEPVRATTLTSLVDSWEPMSDADALPVIDDPAPGT